MFHLRYVDSLDLPELEPYRTMRRPGPHVEQRIFVAEGDKVVRRLLASSFSVVSALMWERWVESFAPLFDARPENIPLFIAAREQLEALVGFTVYQGVMAVGRFPEPPSLEVLLQTSGFPRLFLALDGLSNAENMGVVVRNCAAFGVDALIVGETSSTPYMRRSVRNSMGAIFKLPVIEPVSLVATLQQLRRAGVYCVAAHAHAHSLNLTRCDLTRDCCIVLGAEGHGLSEEVLAACDAAVLIPMAGGVDSLNVANAGAIFLYETARQRGRM